MALTQSSTLRRIESHGQIPTLPGIMLRVLDVLDDQSSCADDITSVLASDPVISARILRLANSAFFGARYQVDSIHRAVVTVGFDAVKHMALATTVLDGFSHLNPSCPERESFWLHALGSAKAAQLLAFSLRKISMPEACFTAGLLHGLGKLVLSMTLREEYDEVIRQATEEQCRLRVIERRLLQTDHAEVGGWLMEQWSFPPLIVASVRYAHRPEQYRGPFQNEVAIVALAGDLATAAGFGDGGEPVAAPIDEWRLEALQLGPADVAEISETLAILKDDARNLLGLFQRT